MANANQVIINGETILDLRSDTVTPETLQKDYTAHDKSGTKIIGTLEASSPGAAKETWVIKSDATGGFATTQIAFTSNGQKFTSIGAYDSTGLAMILYYDSYEVAGYDPGVGGVYEFDSEAYRKLTFDAPPTGDLLTWLQANGVKQPNDTAVQPSKALTITSNGTVSVTPDAPYDALKKVDVTVNVASGGGGTCRLRINVTTPPIDNSEWGLEVHPAFSTSIDEYITLDANNLSAEIDLPNNGMFALVTTSTIDFVNTSDWGIFDEAGISTDYVKNPDIVRTYICYAGETGDGTWGIVFR